MIKTIKYSLLTTTILMSSLSFSQENEFNLKMISQDFNDFFIHSDINKKLDLRLNHKTVEDILYLSFNDQEENSLFLSKILFEKNPNGSFDYYGRIFHKNENDNPKLKTIMSEFENFPFTGNVKKEKDNYIVSYNMGMDKIVSIENEFGKFNVSPYKINFVFDNLKQKYNADILFKNIVYILTPSEDESLEVKLSNFTLNGNKEKINFSIDNFNIQNNKNQKQNKMLYKNIKGVSERKVTLDKNIYSFNVTVDSLEMNDFVNSNLKTVYKDIKFNYSTSFTNLVDFKKILSGQTIDEIEMFSLINTFFSNPIEMKLNTSFVENGFNNGFNFSYKSEKVDIQKIMDNGNSVILESIDGLEIDFKINLSPKYSMFMMFLPQSISNKIDSKEDGSISLTLDENDIKNLF